VRGGAAGALGDGDVVRVSSYACISHANQMRLMAMSVEVLHRAVAGGAAAIGGGNGNGNGNGGGDDKGNGAAAAAGAAAGAAAAGHNAGGAPASPADGGAGGKDQAAAVTPARPAAAAAAAADDAAGPAVAPATAARPPAPTPGEQPRMTPGTLAAAGLAGVTPARGHAAALSPGPPPPTALAPAAAAAAAGGGGGGGGAIPVRAAGRPEPAGVVPIAALNPYESGCTIKAKVVRKNPLRSFSRGGGGAGGGGGGGGSSVFSCELADAQGGAIQATFWREAADRVHASLHEGRVYYFSRFSVKPSNRAYSAVRNDYELSFDAARGGCEVEEAADQQASAEAVALAQRACAADPVPVARLPAHVGRKAPVDVLALVLQVGPVGSVKRKADNAELARRDLVVGDSTGRSVVLTVWNALAGSAALERAAAQAQAGGAGGGGRPMVLQVTSVRVGDYNGCSLSTVARSELTAEPASAEADALREWWDAASAAGAPPAFSPLGAAAAGGDGAAGSRRGKITPVSEMLVPRGQEPAADAKPTYSTVLVSYVFLFLLEGGRGASFEAKVGRKKRSVSSSSSRKQNFQRRLVPTPPPLFLLFPREKHTQTTNAPNTKKKKKKKTGLRRLDQRRQGPLLPGQRRERPQGDAPGRRAPLVRGRRQVCRGGRAPVHLPGARGGRVRGGVPERVQQRRGAPAGRQDGGRAGRDAGRRRRRRGGRRRGGGGGRRRRRRGRAPARAQGRAVDAVRVHGAVQVARVQRGSAHAVQRHERRARGLSRAGRAHDGRAERLRGGRRFLSRRVLEVWSPRKARFFYV